MKKNIILFLLPFILCGCATYRFKHGDKPYDKGYVVSRSNFTIPEYTIGKDNTVPVSMELAIERFYRRKNVVEDYYKQMGSLKGPMGTFLDYPATFGKFIWGMFTLPSKAVANYKYEHNSAYRTEVDKREEDEFLNERARLDRIRNELNTYIQNDLAKETIPAAEENLIAKLQQTPPAEEGVRPPEEASAVVPVEKEPVSVVEETAQPEQLTQAQEGTQAQEPAIEEQKPEEESVAVKGQPKEKKSWFKMPKLGWPKFAKKEPKPKPESKVVSSKSSLASEPKAVILVHPAKGFSPLKVSFSAGKSYSRNSRIVSYEWDFGDGDTSNRVRCHNTFYSSSFEPRQFNVTLTVKDAAGKTATTSVAIEVLNK